MCEEERGKSAAGKEREQRGESNGDREKLRAESLFYSRNEWNGGVYPRRLITTSNLLGKLRAPRDSSLLDYRVHRKRTYNSAFRITLAIFASSSRE